MGVIQKFACSTDCHKHSKIAKHNGALRPPVTSKAVTPPPLLTCVLEVHTEHLHSLLTDRGLSTGQKALFSKCTLGIGELKAALIIDRAA